MIVSHVKTYKDRSTYEKTLTWILVGLMGLTFLAGFIEGVVG